MVVKTQSREIKSKFIVCDITARYHMLKDIGTVTYV